MSPELSPLNLTDVGISYGKRRILEAVSLRVEPGQVYALLGRNGTGKSSLVRCLLGLQCPTQGTASLFGEDAWTSRHRAMNRVGVVPESPDAPPRMRMDEVVAFCRKLHAKWDGIAVDERLRRAGIAMDARFGSLSRGQKAQASLALALGHGPELLVLDDPTLGLDAVARRGFFESLVGELADHGVAVLLTTHDLVGVEGVADRVGILRDGRLDIDEPLETLKARLRRIRWGTLRPALAGMKVLREDQSAWGGEAIVLAESEAAFEPLTSPGEHGTEVESVALEEAFIALVDENQEVRV
jgi:ABC-2 type transport system ATP-binding protein